jgi:hypothetical protein
MDLLTVVTHELGHLLGYGDTVEPGIMAGTLATGVRIFPDSAAPITPTTTSFTLTNPTAGDLARVAPHLAVVASDGLAPTLDATARLREATVSAAAFATRADSFVSAATEARAAASSTAGTLAMGPAVFVPAPAISLVPGFWSVDVRTNGSSAGTSNPATASDENEERPTGPVSPADTGDESRKPVQPDETALPAMPVLPKSKFGAAPLLVVIEWLKACAADLTDGPDCTPILVDEGDDPFATREAKDGPAGDALGALAALAFVLGSRPTVTASRREAEGRRRSRFSATHGAEKDR